MKNASIDDCGKKIWDYMHLNHTLKKCDVIFVFGSSDVRVAKRGAELFLQGYGDYLVISGGLGRISKDLFRKPEAEMFADIAKEMGVPREKIILETKATNTGENIAFMHKILEENNLHPKSLLLVQKPYMERRVYATFKKIWPDAQAEVIVTSPPIPYDDYFTTLLPKKLVLSTMVGDVQRIQRYPALGFQIPQEVPPSIHQAAETLISAGYDMFVL